jgi:hypothetical protein
MVQRHGRGERYSCVGNPPSGLKRRAHATRRASMTRQPWTSEHSPRGKPPASRPSKSRSGRGSASNSRLSLTFAS